MDGDGITVSVRFTKVSVSVAVGGCVELVLRVIDFVLMGVLVKLPEADLVFDTDVDPVTVLLVNPLLDIRGVVE